jgi:hypothetical protein
MRAIADVQLKRQRYAEHKTRASKPTVMTSSSASVTAASTPATAPVKKGWLSSLFSRKESADGATDDDALTASKDDATAAPAASPSTSITSALVSNCA